MTACVRWAPPANRPTFAEWGRCRPFLEEELRSPRRVRVIVALRGFAFDRVRAVLRGAGPDAPPPRVRFAHGAEADA